ncbi:hypothetical protein [Helicobacter felis]|uniref:hypothetical protein n=1 Tax=Helicobacter felis TaxID=214 RepID=UPI0013154F8F|nr:hypothetical protein [Helicobacter felis]
MIDISHYTIEERFIPIFLLLDTYSVFIGERGKEPQAIKDFNSLDDLDKLLNEL